MNEVSEIGVPVIYGGSTAPTGAMSGRAKSFQQVMGPVTGVRVGEARCSFRGSVEKTALEEAGTCLHAN